jgi:hypothetical protein
VPQQGKGRYELYDLEADPEELTDVRGDNPQVAAELAGRLQEHIRRLQPLTGGSFQSLGDVHDGMSFDALPSLE